MPSETPLEIRQEWARLRQIMYEPTSVWLCTDADGERWLTDQFVLYKVTGCWTIKRLDAGPGGRPELRDGSYKLTVSSGLQERKSVPPPDLEKYFEAIGKIAFYPASPSEWSVAEHPGKAQLWVSEGEYCLLGESTWTAIKKHHPDVAVTYAIRDNLFSFEQDGIPFAYAAGIRIPDGQEAVAAAIASKLDSTSNHALESAP